MRLALLVAVGCSGTPVGEPTVAPAPRAFEPVASLEDALATITAEHLRDDVEALADDDLRGRATPSPGLQAAAAHIAARFGAAQLSPLQGAPEFRQTFRCGRGMEASSNIVGWLAGRDSKLGREAVVVSAHYDHIGESHGAGDDVIFNGANDNASGVAALIAVAEAMAQLREPPRRSIVFIAFCGEELGTRGSKHWVGEPLWPLSRTVAVVNLEMLGRAEDPTRVWITGMAYSDLHTRFRAGVPFVAASAIGDLEANTFNRSDNYPFAKAGVVAHTFAAGRLDELYHSVADESHDMAYARMETIVRAIARGVHALAYEDGRPAWSAEGAAAGYGSARAE